MCVSVSLCTGVCTAVYISVSIGVWQNVQVYNSICICNVYKCITTRACVHRLCTGVWDYVQVFGACLRAQCGAEGTVRDQSCCILRRVTRLCGDTKFEEPAYYGDRVHMTMDELLSRFNCSRSG